MSKSAFSELMYSWRGGDETHRPPKNDGSKPMTAVKWISYGKLDSLLCESWDLFFHLLGFPDFIIT